jgi:uncharacterized protein YjbI with pentapeptide repeats
MRRNLNLWNRKRSLQIFTIIGVVSITFMLIMLLIIIIVDGYKFSWTGFNAQTIVIKPGLQYQPAKTLWDWLQLLIIPTVLVIIGIIINRVLDRRYRDIASDKLKEDMLQVYFDKMSELLLEKNLRHVDEDNEARHLARARTLTALHGLDIARKGRLIKFLSQARLLTLGLDLSNMDLKGIYLFHADLRGTYLYLSNLNNSTLVSCDLSKIILYGASLINAALSLANLSEANLEKADLRGAHINGTDLSGANLVDANLSKAFLVNANLNGANLNGANLNGANLNGANLKGAVYSKLQLSTVASCDNITQ